MALRSDMIRWSVDLRWQRSNELSGFEGIKDVLPLRDANGVELPDFWASWKDWESVNRNAVQKDAVAGWHAGDKDEFDTVVAGPWINRWGAAQQV
jgi:hypothetical protein